MKKLMLNFLKCGVTGWCIEISFTALNSLRRRDMKLMGQTSLWMFPIYGSAALLEPFCRMLKGKRPLVRGLFYAALILTAEYATGTLLADKDICPWNYDRSKWHVKKVIRLDYLPNWILAGLLFERLLTPPHSDRTPDRPNNAS